MIEVFRRTATASACRLLPTAAITALLGFASGSFAQTSPAPATPQTPHYQLAPAFDTSAIDKKVDPCQDFYKFACGNYATQHPIPSDQTEVDQFYALYNVNSERLQGILNRYSAGEPDRTPNQQKIGDDYAACMDTALIDQKGLAPVQSLLDEVSKVSKPGLPYFTGELQRYGVNAFFSFGEMQDFKDSTKQIAVIDQGGLGLPERDYYTRTGDKDKQLRQQYVDHIAKMLTLAGEPADRANAEAKDILAFETKLAEASLTNTERRDPAAIYHPETLSAFASSLHGIPFASFLEAIHAPQIDSLNVTTPKFFPVMVDAIFSTRLDTLRAYLRYQVLTRFAGNLPHAFDAEDFHFNGTLLYGQPEQQPRWKRCSATVDAALGEALGQVYVEQYFAGDSKAKTLEVVHDIESAMDRDIDTLQWMSPDTRVRAKEKLHAITDKIGYPEHWRDYSKLSISPTDPLGNSQRATAFENDRQLAKIGQPVDPLEWSMTPPTINAYYDPSMNNINFPAGILQPAFYDPRADIAVNFGHIGAIVGHELTHGFDDEGAKFDFKGNLNDWWTADDKKNFQTRTACLEKEYNGFTAVDDVHVNGKLTLGENTADNGGLLLAYMAYLDRARQSGQDPKAKVDGYTGPQRFYIAFAQNYCENTRPEAVRQQVLTDPHSPNHFRANGSIVNQPGFAGAFSCKANAPMAPAQNCRVW
jgi:predicted metalloendopeptidase